MRASDMSQDCWQGDDQSHFLIEKVVESCFQARYAIGRSKCMFMSGIQSKKAYTCSISKSQPFAKYIQVRYECQAWVHVRNVIKTLLVVFDQLSSQPFAQRAAGCDSIHQPES